MNQLIENVLNLARRKTPNIHQLDLGAWLRETVDEYRRQYNLDTRQVSLAVQSALSVDADSGQLHQVIWNLLRNAQIHSPAGKPIAILIEADRSPEDSRARIDIINPGAPIAEELRERLFEPFFSTNAKGTGLGLYLARELCEANRGSLEFIAIPGVGNCFRVKIPLSTDTGGHQ